MGSAQQYQGSFRYGIVAREIATAARAGTATPARSCASAQIRSKSDRRSASGFVPTTVSTSRWSASRVTTSPARLTRADHARARDELEAAA